MNALCAAVMEATRAVGNRSGHDPTRIKTEMAVDILRQRRTFLGDASFLDVPRSEKPVFHGKFVYWVSGVPERAVCSELEAPS